MSVSLFQHFQTKACIRQVSIITSFILLTEIHLSKRPHLYREHGNLGDIKISLGQLKRENLIQPKAIFKLELISTDKGLKSSQ